MKASAICKIIALTASVSMMMSGCMNAVNLKDIAVVEGMAVDTAEDKGSVELTVQTLNAGKSASNGEAPSGNMTLNVSNKGDSIVDAVSLMPKKLSKDLFFGQTKIIILSRSTAENAIKDNMDYFVRATDSRSDVAICMSEGEAKKILESKENDSRVPGENMLYLMKTGEEAGVSAYITTGEALNLYADKTSDLYLPVLKPDEKDKSVQTAGIGIFNGDKLACILNDEEASGFLILKDLTKRLSVEFNDSRLGKIGVEFSNISVKNHTGVENSSIVFYSSIKASVVINEIEKGSTTMLEKADLERIKEDARKELVSRCSKAFYACRSAGSDCLRIGDCVARDLPQTYDACQGNWKDYYSGVKFAPSAKVEFKKLSNNSQRY